VLDALGIDPAWILTVILLSLRLGATFVATPLLAPASVPVQVRVLILLGLAAALTPALPALGSAQRALPIAGAGALFQAALTELALGATLGLGIVLAFAAVSFAGQLLGVQIGFGLAQVVDPASKLGVPVLASALSQAAVLVFFLVDGHHALLRGLAFSLERFPLGRPWPVAAGYAPLLAQVVGLYSLGFALAAPVVFALLLVEFALGVVARNLPQINMLVIGIPVKVVAGLLALALWSSSGMGDVLTRVYASIYRTWDAIFVAELRPPADGAGPRGRAA
jgi:flagellar biosynthetic protein FliR